MDQAAQPQCLQVDDGVAAGLRRMGVSEDDIARAQAQLGSGDGGDAPEADFEVHEDCWESWLFFLRVQRQWVFVPMSAGMGVTSVRQGLNWPGIRAMVLLSRIKPARWEQLVDDLLTIEYAVMKAEQERHNKG